MVLKRPKMVLFDYGQTLIHEPYFNKALGMEAVLAHAVSNPLGRTARELGGYIDALETEMERFHTADGHSPLLETHNLPFQRYVFASQGLAFSLPEEVLETLYWDAAAPGQPTDGILPLLDLLAAEGIRTGVISNLSFSGAALRARLDRLLPNHRFEFVLATSEYVFRKPSPRIFRLALTMAGLEPQEAWYCGDHPRYDVEGAAAAGLQPVWYTGAHAPHWSSFSAPPPAVPHLALAHWQDLPALLAGAEAPCPA